MGAAFVAYSGLQEFAFTDYEDEALPAVRHLIAGDLSAFVHDLPGYGGALILQAPFALAAEGLGSDHDLWAWRGQALLGIVVLCALGIVLGRTLAQRLGGRSGAAWGGVVAMLIAGAPFALLAQEYGHPEELLVTGLVVGAVTLASNGNLMTAGALVGLAAAAKPWAVIAVPIVLLGATDRRSVLQSLAAVVVVGGLLMAPTFVAKGPGGVTATAHAETTGIFRPDNVFWFAGRPNPNWNVGTPPADVTAPGAARQPGWAQRLEPAWVGSVSHPLTVLFAIGLSATFLLRRGRHCGRQDLLLLLAAACWWRCLLDTWTMHYYWLPALVALAAWEAWRGRPPVLAIGVTALSWVSLQTFPASSMTPDVHTVVHLAWAVPLGVGLVIRVVAPRMACAATTIAFRRVRTRLPTLARVLGGGPRLPAPPHG